MSVFVKKSEASGGKDLTIAALTGRRSKKGHVGIEVEVEAKRAGLPKNNVGPYWVVDRDGSLRGADNAEYILTKPIDFDKVPDAIKTLWAKFDELKVALVDSNRTSVHVHLNVLPWFQNRLTAFVGLWYIFEEMLTAYCGDDRQGNLFCLRAKDGPAIVTGIRNYVESHGSTPLPTQTHHYAALNLSSIAERGSVEVRTFRGVTEPQPILDWVRILRRLYEVSDNYKDPRTLIEDFSVEGPMNFLHKTFGDETDTILKGVEFDDDALRQSMHEGMRYAQDVIYARDWTGFNPKETPEDPFDRKIPVEAEPPRNQEDDVDFRWGRDEPDHLEPVPEDIPNFDIFNREVRRTRAVRDAAAAARRAVERNRNMDNTQLNQIGRMQIEPRLAGRWVMEPRRTPREIE